MIAGRPGIFTLLLLLLLTGCANQMQLPAGSWSERQAQLERIDAWQLTGKLGVRIPGDNGSATLRWQQKEKHYTLDLSGPLGSGRVLIEGEPGRVTLHQGGEAPLTAGSAEELILLSTNWTIPVTHLTWWIRALPAPKPRITRWETDDLGQVTVLEQAGWHIQYTDYYPVTNDEQALMMPRKIVAAYEDIRLTLLIRAWHLGADK